MSTNLFINTHQSQRERNLKVLIFVCIFAFFSLFFITKGSVPYSSEIRYVEHSFLGKGSGSVVPASCDTGTAHDAEVCGVWTVAACGAWWSCSSGTTYVNTYVYSGANVSPGCILPQPSNVTCSSNICTPKVALSFSGIPSVPTAQILSLTSSAGAFVDYGTLTTISWTSADASACTLGTTGSGVASAVSSNGSFTPGYWVGIADSVRTYVLSCSSGQTPVTQSITITFEGKSSAGVFYGGGGGGCFVAGTQVLMGDGSYKNIEDVTFTDSLMSSNGPEPVLKRYIINYKGAVYAFNGSGNYFVTPTHPFMTTEGWKSLDPEGTRRESPGIVVSQLEVGDILLMKGGTTTTLTQLDKVYREIVTYNFGINGTHDFYADDYLVHNVDMHFIERASALMANLKY